MENIQGTTKEKIPLTKEKNHDYLKAMFKCHNKAQLSLGCTI